MAIRSYYENGTKFFEVYVNGHDSQGKRIQQRRTKIPTAAKAEKVQFEFKRELAKRKEQAVPYRWEEWFSECLKRIRVTYRASTLENYEGRLNKWISPLWTGLELHEITREKVYDTLFVELGSKLTPWTRRSLYKMIRRIFEMAVEDGHLARNPCAGIKLSVPEADQKVLTNSEVESFLREAKVTGHRFYPVWAMALLTGMRSGELFALKWSDVDFEARIISVSRQWTSKCGFGPTKTQKSRVVPVSEDLLKFLKELKLERGSEEFVLPHLPEWRHGELARITREFCQAIGVTSVKFHDLRATFITNLLARGESLARVMSIVGHSQIKTTNLYLRRAGVDVKGATDLLGYTLPTVQDGENVISIKF